MTTRLRLLAGPAVLAWMAVAGTVSAAPAAPAASARSVTDETEIRLPSCVSGSAPLALPVSVEQATLDLADRRRFQAAAEQRYPLYQRGGGAPAQVLLVRRGGRWVYVTLWSQGHSGTCVAALFAAERFDFTPGWLAKYQPRPLDRLD
ncbi:hypothetical protein ACWA7J_14105 [Leptothrix sp. BB-4]